MSSKKYTSKGIIVSAPSGAGKTTIVRHLLAQDLDLEFSISCTTRKPRGKEVDGEDYYFLSVPVFKSKIEERKFVEWEEVYTDMYYGTLYSELDRIHANDHIIIFDVDVFGGLNLKKKLGDRALSIFIKPPSIDVLAERLIKRDTDTQEDIQNRLDKAEKEMLVANKFDVILVNDDLEKACSYAVTQIRKFLGK